MFRTTLMCHLGEIVLRLSGGSRIVHGKKVSLTHDQNHFKTNSMYSSSPYIFVGKWKLYPYELYQSHFDTKKIMSKPKHTFRANKTVFTLVSTLISVFYFQHGVGLR